jgi:thiol-disulfide isomerase/thioredoxin
MFKRMTAITLAMLLCAGSTSMAQQGGRPKPKDPESKQPESKPAPKLKVGDDAPKLSVEEWVKGTKVEKFDNGKVYVVEFWATWCGPCIKNIPHLTSIQKRYKDKGVTIIGVASSERGNSDDEKRAKVKDFVKKRDKEIGYTIAYDEDRSMSRDWMQAANQQYIPTAFIVGKDGKLAWIGSPAGPEFERELKKAIGQGRADAGPANPVITLAAFQPAGEKARPTEKKQEAKQPEPKVKVGDKAPALTLSKFVKGDPVTGFERGSVYIVEFWATWCGPCIQSIPHITDLQRQYKDDGLKIIGVSIREDDTSKVEPFVERMGDKMDYIVALDRVPELRPDDERSQAERRGEMDTNWMIASGQEGIPTAFIIDRESRIAWIGHPMEMDEPLKQVMDGSWDIEKEVKRARHAAEVEPQMRQLQAQRQRALRQQDFDGALRSIEKMIELRPDLEPQLGMEKFFILFSAQKDYDRAYAYANQLADGALKNHSIGLNFIAWTIVDPDTRDTVEKKDLKLAMKAAQRANELTKSKDGAIMDTLAAVYHAQGDIKKALEWQRKAVDASEGTQHETELRDRLEQYEAEAEKGG